MNAHDTISEAVSKVLARHESRNPWQKCSCGWRGPTITLSSIVRKRLFQKHVADTVADALMKRDSDERHPIQHQGFHGP